MKTAILVSALLLASAHATAYGITGFLSGQSTSGMYKYCRYSNGKVITIRLTSMCPMQVSG